MSKDLRVIGSVILEPDETGELLGQVLDASVGKLHADMQLGRVSAGSFDSLLARMQSLRDDVVSRAEAGQPLPNGQRLCYFTPETIQLLRDALAAATADPSGVAVPLDTLWRLREKFVRADDAIDNQAPHRVVGRSLSRLLDPKVRDRLLLLLPAITGPIYGLQIWTEDEWTILSSLVMGLGCAYLSDFAARRWGFSPWLRVSAVALWPFFLFFVAPVYFVIWLVLRIVRPSAPKANQRKRGPRSGA